MVNIPGISGEQAEELLAHLHQAISTASLTSGQGHGTDFGPQDIPQANKRRF